MATSEIVRTKDGVPQWDGSANSFTSYEEACYLYEAGTEMHKRSLCGPRLISELTGAAKRMVSGRSPTWVSKYDGVRTLMEYLRQCLGKLQIPEMTEHLSRYFKHCKRRAQESMNEYITKKAEAYLRAEQALQRVVAGQKKKSSPTGVADGSRRSETWDWYSSRRASADSTADTEADRDEGADDETGAHNTEAASSGDRDWQDWWSNGTSWSWNYGYGNSYYWGSYGSWEPYYRSYGWQSQQESEPVMPKVELLPSFVQGWYLLQDANLSQTERNLVQTALGGSYEVGRVAQELRNQWSDNEVKHRDQNRHSGFMGETLSDSEGHEGEEPDQAWVSREDWDEEAKVAMDDAETEAHQAMAAIAAGKRTLREARYRQNQVRLGRQYYRNGPRQPTGSTTSGAGRSSSGGTGNQHGDANMTCLKCGGTGHRAANCKDKGQKAMQAEHEPDEQAPFVCFSDRTVEQYASFAEPADDEKAYMGEAVLTTAEAVREGHAILDGGATRTLASVYAVECLMKKNQGHHGQDRVKSVDVQNTPTFGFGNSSSDRCVSTVDIGLTANGKEGQMSIHVLDKGQGPILLSVATLRHLGALVDFSNDLVVFRNLSKNKVIKVGRSTTGHQILSLKDDLYKNATEAACDIPSLLDFLQKPE
ncbi:unnamed protein product [Symbiodinium sp. CCMP2592]|nr:unnamed protein product [Symbiodinium sp. CCMP2592]